MAEPFVGYNPFLFPSVAPVPSNIIYSITFDGNRVSAPFSTPVLRLRLTAKKIAGGTVCANDTTLEIAFTTDRTTPSDALEWQESIYEEATGLFLLKKPDSLAGSYFLAWRVVNGDQIDGGFVPGLITF